MTIKAGQQYTCPGTIRIEIVGVSNNVIQYKVLETPGAGLEDVIWGVGEIARTSVVTFNRLVNRGIYKKIKE